jgi:prolipoprotein diacylglyceryl transferase
VVAVVTTYASGAFLATIPSPSQGVWQLGPVPLRAYALCIIVGIIVAIWWGERRFVARGGPAGAVTDIAVFAVPFGLVGGRLYHVATDWYRYFGEGKHPLDALKIWDGGLGIWGAIALGAVGAWIGCRVKGVPLPAYADAIAPGIVAAQALGRVGNYFNQELYGAPTTLPWGLEIDPAHRPSLYAGSATFHPTFLYELIWNLVLAAFLVWLGRRGTVRAPGLFALYVTGYSVGRIGEELLRVDPSRHVLGLRLNFFVASLLAIAGLLWFLRTQGRLRRGGRSDVRQQAGDHPGAGGLTRTPK